MKRSEFFKTAVLAVGALAITPSLLALPTGYPHHLEKNTGEELLNNVLSRINKTIPGYNITPFKIDAYNSKMYAVVNNKWHALKTKWTWEFKYDFDMFPQVDAEHEMYLIFIQYIAMEICMIKDQTDPLDAFKNGVKILQA